MKLSTRSLYGLRALAELGLMTGRGPVSASVIAAKQELSVAYLEQLLHRLKKQGLVISVRGPKGGYLLAKDPDRITIAEVVQVLDGGTPGPSSAEGAQPIAHAVFRCVHARLAEALDRVTLQDICQEAAELSGEPLDHRYVFHI